MLRELTTDNFNETIASGVTLVDFYSPSCGPCQILGKLMPHLAKKYDGQATIAKVNTTQQYKLAQAFTIISVPTVIIFHNGQPVERLKGLFPPETYVEKVQEWIDK